MEKWQKVEDTIFRFENKGDSIEGFYLKKEKSGLYDNFVYHIRTKDQVNIVFGTAVLNSRMSAVDIGKEVKLVFTGTQPSKKAGQSDIKLFDVFVR